MLNEDYDFQGFLCRFGSCVDLKYNVVSSAFLEFKKIPSCILKEDFQDAFQQLPLSMTPLSPSGFMQNKASANISSQKSKETVINSNNASMILIIQKGWIYSVYSSFVIIMTSVNNN